MLQLVTNLMLEGISLSMQNDGVMITITMSKGIFTAHQMVPVHSVELKRELLQEYIDECKKQLEAERLRIRRFPEVIPPNLCYPIGKGI